MFEFSIEYYYERFQIGNIDKSVTRKAVVYAATLKDATNIVSTLDRDYIRIADNGVSIKQIRE